MCKRLFFLISIILVLGLVGNASADLVGYWNFNDGTANDSGPSGHHGTFMFDATTVTDGSIPGLGAGNKVLTLDGTDDYVNCGGGGGGGTWADFTTNAMTVACWLKLPDGYTNNYQPAMAKSGMWQWYRNFNGYGIRLYTNGTTGGDDNPQINYYPQGDYPNIYMTDGEWHHTAATFDGVGGVRHIYIDGYHAKEEAVVSGGLAVSTHAVSIGARLQYLNRWQGFLDECYLYDHVLTHQEILVLASRFWAFDPNAFDGEQDVLLTLPVLTWRAGAKVAATQGHKVYIGTDKALVDANDALVFKVAVDPNRYSGAPMGSLASDTTYYWRVIEVNGVEEWPGDVWSFTTVSQKATDPKPVDTSKYVSTTRARVSWKPGIKSTRDAVYFGTNKADIDANDPSVYRGQVYYTASGGSGDPNWAISPALVADETYYWRIDVNFPSFEKNTGNVWSFEVSAPVSDANLIGWWPMNEEDVSGNVTWDISGNEHHGTLKDDADLITDASIGVPGNKVLDLDGFLDYVNVGGGKADVSDPRTWADMDKTFGIACWVKLPNGYFNNYQPAVAKSGSWQWYRNYTGTGIRLYTNATADTYINYNPNIHYPNIDLDDGEWHHTASTFDGVSGTRKIWIDGSLAQEESVTGSFASSTYDMSIGARLAFNNRWRGQLDDVRLYNRVLTIEDVLQMMRFDPNKAWNPYPRNLSVDVADRPLTLTWRPGDNAAGSGLHRVYFGTDKALVDACDVSVDNSPQDVNYLDVGELPFATTYYWRVDESNGATTWKGVDWTFTMANFKRFDDFESYIGNNLITLTWELIDWTGGAINLGMSSNNEPVNGGERSMKYEYDNQVGGGLYWSETYRDFGGSPQDWTYATGDVKSLRLYFNGETGNDPDDMWVVLEDSNSNSAKKLYDGDMDDIKAGEWKEWDIDLSFATTSPNNVHLGYIKKFYIGFGERGNLDWPTTQLAGTVYFDDLRVYPPRCVPERLKPDGDMTEDCFVDYEDVDVMMGDWLDNDITVVPSNPGDSNLIGWWDFDDDTANDSSGNIPPHDGTIVTGGVGTSISIVDDAVRGNKVLDVNNIVAVDNAVVDCGGDANDVGDPCWANLTEQVSVAAWFTLDSIHTSDQYMITKGNTWQITSRGTSDGIRSYYDVLDPTALTTTMEVMDDKWHHVAITYDSTVPKRKLYLDGRLVGRDEPTGTLNVHIDTFVIGGRLNVGFGQRGWVGRIDDVRYYDDVLTHEEVVHLAGYTSPVYFDVYSPANITDVGDPCDSRFVNFKDYNALANTWFTEELWPSGW